MSLDGAALTHQRQDTKSSSSGVLSDEELTRNMMALDAGLDSIEEAFSDHVTLAYEDPATFGAGHFVLYPLKGGPPRVVIEEQYTGTDWSDDDRLPTSWT